MPKRLEVRQAVRKHTVCCPYQIWYCQDCDECEIKRVKFRHEQLREEFSRSIKEGE